MTSAAGGVKKGGRFAFCHSEDSFSKCKEKNIMGNYKYVALYLANVKGDYLNGEG